MSWPGDIIHAMHALGGKGRLNQIYHQIEATRSDLPDNWTAVVRATIYQHSSDASGYVDGNPDLFCRISRGVWGLRVPRDIALLRLSDEFQQQALSEITLEEFRSCGGDQENLNRLIDEKKAAIRQRLG